MKPWNVLLFVCPAFTVIGQSAPAQERAYRSPYRVEFTFPTAELVGDLERTERGDFRLEADVPFPQWYTPRTMERWRAWGPPCATIPHRRASSNGRPSGRGSGSSPWRCGSGDTGTSTTTYLTGARRRAGPGRRRAPGLMARASIAAT